MALTVNANLTALWDGETTTNWSGETLGQDPDIFRIGTYSLGMTKVSQETVLAQFDYQTDQSAVLNIDNGEHIYAWINVANAAGLDTKALGGIRLYVEDTAGAYGYWYVGGNDNYNGGWKCFVASPEVAFDDSSGAIDFTIIKYIGVGIKMVGKTTANAHNVWIDIGWYGYGLQVEGGTDVAPGDWSEIFDGDDTAAYGIISRQEGSYVLQGPIEFGDSGGNDFFFKDESQVIIFSEAPVSSTHYKLEVTGSSAGTSSFQFGNKSGDAGIQGCYIKTATGSQNFDFVADTLELNEFKLYGNTFISALTSSFISNDDDTNYEIISNNFESCGEVLPHTCSVQYCKFINAEDRGVKMDTDHNILDCDFISCVHGVHISEIGTFNFDNLQFSNCTYDFENSIVCAVTASALNLSNVGSYENTNGGTSKIENSVFLNISVEDSDGVAVSESRVYVVDENDSILVDTVTDNSGDVQQAYNYTGDTPIIVKIRKSSPPGTRYLPYRTSGVVDSGGYTLTAVVTVDTIAS